MSRKMTVHMSLPKMSYVVLCKIIIAVLPTGWLRRHADTRVGVCGNACVTEPQNKKYYCRITNELASAARRLIFLAVCGKIIR